MGMGIGIGIGVGVGVGIGSAFGRSERVLPEYSPSRLMGFLLDHSFLLLSLLLTAPAVLVALLRRDLRSAQWRMALVSLPFAATEWLFFPSYWEPRFLFDLVRVFGFGLEDLLFVAALGAFATTAWPFAARRTLRPLDEEHLPPTGQTDRSGRPASNGALLRSGVGWLGACFALVATAYWLDVPMIYAAPLIMQVLGAFMCVARRDLFLPSLGGAAVTLATYSALCLVLAALIPGVFNLDWKTERFLNRFVWGIPVEELLYAWTSGFVATCFYPSVMRLRFVPRPTTPLESAANLSEVSSP